MNTNDHSVLAPRLVTHMAWMALEALPDFSEGPHNASPEQAIAAIRAAGYEGIQFFEPISSEVRQLCEQMNLVWSSSGRVNQPAEAEELARRFADEGVLCATLHVGWGIEDDAEALALFDSIFEASARFQIPLYIETHRATLFQDMWRTVQFIRRRPELRINGDFSHWYTGQEMFYGSFEDKVEFVAPVLERVRYLHGRIGNPSSMQVNLGDGSEEAHPAIIHFKTLWTASCRGFLSTAKPGDLLCFTPELLAPRIYYARTFPGLDGQPREESDRWQQSLLLCRIAHECFASAQAILSAQSGSSQ